MKSRKFILALLSLLSASILCVTGHIADGSLRFDALAGLRGQYGADLAGLSWDTVYQRPDLQLLKEDLAKLREEIANDRVHKDDFQLAIDRLFQKLDRIEDKLDKKADK